MKRTIIRRDWLGPYQRQSFFYLSPMEREALEMICLFVIVAAFFFMATLTCSALEPTRIP